MGNILTIMNMVRDASTPPDLIDTYELPGTQLADYRGIVVSMGADQLFLETQRERLSAWVRAGGKLLANGLPMRRWVDGLPSHRKMEFHGLDDVWLSAVEPHPIWEGVERRDMLLRTGVPGQHSFEELREIGVAGFYARSFLAELPEGTRVITGIGPGKLPVDISYRLGEGEVIVHNGNDLSGFAFPGTSAAGLRRAITEYLEK
ncbi:hypothetical protein ACRQD2_07665 [Actinotignum sp. GS-2025e]|uniref:hypothetical protein n=1 Tax=Actinotignum TaxID=1653174 RepID=UPI0025514B7A|nr:hypothetical protein [Actinotignum timonense]MDK8783007.1 hypothetical protein [Actinotignum timonense]MDY5137655.1 hypothetical protein [Actinotignum timonense]